ncbi:nucleoside/nucleotide kinase family protein [Bacillus cereus]
MISLQSFGKKPFKIALIGKTRSGKDSVAEILTELGFPIQRIAFGDAMKEMFHLANPNVPRSPKPIQEYINYGTTMREKDPEVFVRPTMSKLWFEQALDKGNDRTRSYVFTDVRQPNELEAVKEAGFKIIRVFAAEEVRVARMLANGESVSREILEAHTERYMDDYQEDYLLVNNWSRDELRRQVVELVYRLIEEEDK